MMTFREFKDEWEHMPPRGNGFLRLKLEHPLNLQIGYNSSIYKSLIVIDTGVVEGIPSSYAVRAVNSELRGDRWALEFQLLHPSYEEEFLRLCWDMIEVTANSEKPREDLIRRYMSWQKLLQYTGKSVMSFQRQKGLLGELLFLKELLHRMGAENAVNAWKGPDGCDQDFQFEETWAEIKTVALAATQVKISSLQQLEQENDGRLIVYVLEESAPGDDKLSLPKLVDSIKDECSNAPVAEDHLDMKLFKYGYREADRDEYDKKQFRYIEKREYLVNDRFPKLTGKTVPMGIVSCNYEISLAAIESYRRDI